jgi:hypothetical protein
VGRGACWRRVAPCDAALHSRSVPAAPLTGFDDVEADLLLSTAGDSRPCSPERPLVVDVGGGSGLGVYALMTAQAGCHVVVVDAL